MTRASGNEGFSESEEDLPKPSVLYVAAIDLTLRQTGTPEQREVLELLEGAKDLLHLEVIELNEAPYWHVQVKGEPRHGSVSASYALLRMAQMLLNTPDHVAVRMIDGSMGELPPQA